MSSVPPMSQSALIVSQFSVDYRDNYTYPASPVSTETPSVSLPSHNGLPVDTCQQTRFIRVHTVSGTTNGVILIVASNRAVADAISGLMSHGTSPLVMGKHNRAWTNPSS